jgi:hypothetical protein
MKDLLVKGNLHIYNVPWSFFKPEGLIIYVEGDVFVHQKEDDFIYPKTDTFIDLEERFMKQNVRDIIAYSPKFKSNR